MLWFILVSFLTVIVLSWYVLSKEHRAKRHTEKLEEKWDDIYTVLKRKKKELNKDLKERIYNLAAGEELSPIDIGDATFYWSFEFDDIIAIADECILRYQYASMDYGGEWIQADLVRIEDKWFLVESTSPAYTGISFITPFIGRVPEDGEVVSYREETYVLVMPIRRLKIVAGKIVGEEE